MTQTALGMACVLMVASTSAAAAQSDDTIAVAAEAGVDPVQLAGAVNTTGMDARTYLVLAGELAPAASPPAAPATPAYDIWDRMADCEAHGNWTANTGNGFYGGLQFTLDSWRRAGGTGRPDYASRATQIAVADHWRALVGWGAWPYCSRRLGLLT